MTKVDKPATAAADGGVAGDMRRMSGLMQQLSSLESQSFEDGGDSDGADSDQTENTVEEAARLKRYTFRICLYASGKF